MKSLQVLPSLEVGGVERGVIDLARAMKKRNQAMVVLSSGGALVAELEKMGFKHYTLPVHRKSLTSLRLVPKIAEIIRRERIQIVHARSRVPAWLAWLAAKWTGVPFVTTCHGYYSNHLLSKIMGWGKRVIVISRVIGRHMIDDFKVSPDRIRLIHRGVDIQQFPFNETHYDQQPSTFKIINIGRLSPIKGQAEFLQGIHLLRKKIPNIEVSMVGSEGKGKTKYTAQLKTLVEKLGLSSCVRFLGTQRDIAGLLKEADLLVLATLVPEAFGRVIVEAGAAGTAVLASKIGGILDIIDHGENGYLFSPGSSEEMAEFMEKMLLDRKKLKQFALNLRKKIEKNFTLDLMADKTLEVYRELEGSKKILIMKLGAMGDLILGIPSFRMIRKRFPSASISLLVDKKLAPIVSPCPYLDEIIPVDRKKLSFSPYLFKTAKKIRKEGFDLSVDLQNSKWTHLMAYLGAIPQRYGFQRGKFGFLINRHDKGYELAEAPVRNQFRILSKMGIQELDERLELWTSPDSEELADKIFSENQITDSQKVIGFAVGSSKQWLTKRWPIDYFHQLAKEISKTWNCRILLIGSEDEKKDVDELFNREPALFINLAGKTSLRDIVSMVKRMDLLVTGDTSPLHIAAAVQCKIVAIFGPTDAKRHMPPAAKTAVFQKHLACQPCYEGVCKAKEHLACLHKVTVPEVFEAVQRQLES